MAGRARGQRSQELIGSLRPSFGVPSKEVQDADALDFVNRVGVLAEAADHHPDITFGWGYAELELTTHDRGGITDVDVELAKRIDTL